MKQKNESYLDIVFEGKNKSYGAYNLRQSYNFRMLQSGMIGMLFVSALFASTLLIGREKEEIIEVPNVVEMDHIVFHKKDIEPPKQKEPKAPENANKSTSSKQREVKQFTVAKIKENNEVNSKDKLQKIEKDESVIIGRKNKMGDRSEFENMEDRPKGDKDQIKGSIAGNVLKKDDIVKPEKPKGPVKQVDQKAKFEGDIASFLRNNLRYPKLAESEGIEGSVSVQFVVEKDGSIGNIKVLKGVGGGCTAEAERVIRLMKNWKPGMLNGEPVASYFVLPITFKLN